MKKLFEGFRKFLTESEEDRTLGKLLQLDPEHAASFIDSLKDVYPDIERRYVDALGVKVERLNKLYREQDIILRRLSDERRDLNREYYRISARDPYEASEFYNNNLDRLGNIARGMKEAVVEQKRLLDEARELRKIQAKFNPLEIKD
tara:strand:- start:599 stop:1039 length:441 start_codon:yes stop_codon:yes gene_type:complete